MFERRHALVADVARDLGDAAFFADGAWRSQLLVNLGHGDAMRGFPRQPRLDFDEVCRIV